MNPASDNCLPQILFLSLGETCQTAYQIRRFTKKNDAFFFDWLITPSDTYKSLYANNKDLFRSNNWELTDHGGIRLLDKGTGLKFQHEFQVKDKATKIIDEALVELHLESARSKFLYLKSKTIQAIRDAETVYLIRYERINNQEKAFNRISDIKKHYSIESFKIKIILASPNISSEVYAEDYFIIKINESNQWSGDDTSWDRLFNIVIHAQKRGNANLDKPICPEKTPKLESPPVLTK